MQLMQMAVALVVIQTQGGTGTLAIQLVRLVTFALLLIIDWQVIIHREANPTIGVIKQVRHLDQNHEELVN